MSEREDVSHRTQDSRVQSNHAFHKPFPPLPQEAMLAQQQQHILAAHVNCQLPILQLPEPATIPRSLHAPLYTQHLRLPQAPFTPSQPYGYLLPSPNKSFYSNSPMEPRRERVSLQTYTNPPLISHFSQASIVYEPPIVLKIKDFMIKWIIEWWLLEIVSWIFGTMCLSTVIGVLLLTDSREIPQWPLGLTINGFLSVFSACAKAALILPTAECLGQLKWNWFKGGPRSMIDFEILDTASRGPWGSLLLLLRSLRTKGLSLASIGAAIILLCLPLDLFFQQVIQYPKVWVAISSQPVVPRAFTYIPPDNSYNQNGTRHSAPDLTLQQVMQPFFYSNGTTPDLDMSCPTSNYYMDGPSLYPNATQCGWFLNITSSSPVLMSGYTIDPSSLAKGEALETRLFPLVDALTRESFYGGSVHFSDMPDPLLDVLIVATPNGASAVYQNATPITYECALHWCVQTLQTGKFSGQLSQNITQRFINQTAVPWPWTVLPDYDYLYSQHIVITPSELDDTRSESKQMVDGSDDSYGLSNDTMLSTIFLMDIVAPSFFTAQDQNSESVVKYYTLDTNGARTRSTNANPWLEEGITVHMDRVAEAMTIGIRNTPNETGQVEYVVGTSWEERVHVEVRWPWLILPLVLSGMSLLFLASTVIRSSRDVDEVGIWKSSALAVLFNGLGDDVQRSVGPNARMGEIRLKARELSVKLVPDEEK
ncbi:uncharacterized protein PV09_03060 [Verruconis gallopava]|uniref:Uncharacterized protein n=1 Tax=Verruconis gallopava TaxID=253628 RepID=A0A0D1YYT4_9PEZI|nr:uncharacterized protein PV09_03060 [Verruconis gallopava]KIW05857.1 hypothetical protein PV09_03060 [Verruconis gallopava]